MKLMALSVVAAVLLTLVAFPSLSQGANDWVDIKDPNELRALYSNKTFKGKDWMDRPWVGHYRADGNGVMLSEGGRYPRTWQVTGNDQVCVKSLTGAACYRFQRHMTKPATYRSHNLANDQVVEFVVEDGVPQF